MTRAVYLPDVSGKTRLEAAHTYADAGIAVFAVEGKTPVLSDLDMESEEVWSRSWKEFSSTDHTKIEQWGKGYWAPSGESYAYRKGIGVDLGKSGIVALDVDRPELVPDAWWSLLDTAPFESSDSEDARRGRYYFRQPESPVGCPVAEWGEVKGRGGLVIVSPSPHQSAYQEWKGKPTKAGKYRASARYRQIRTGELPVLPAEIADGFGEHRDARAAATEEQISAFMKTYQGGMDEDPTLVHNIVATFVREVSGPRPAGRHPSMAGKCAWAAHAAAAGLIDSVTACQALRNAFRRSLALVQDQRTEVPGEFDAMWAWGVGQVTEESLSAYLTRRAGKWKGRSSQELSRIARSMLGTVFEGQELGNNVVDIVEPGQTAADPVPAAVDEVEPVPLTAADADPYDTRRFGRLGEIAQAFADGLGVSADMTLVGMLSAASTACGGRVHIYVDERDWKQPVIFHGINLAPPGGMKSDAGKVCWKPVIELQKERRDDTRSQAELDAMYMDICESRIDKLKKDAVKETDAGKRAAIEADLMTEVNRKAEMEKTRTAPCRLWANDTTPEALIETMARQDGRMAILDTEPRFLKIMSGGAGRKGGNPDPSVMLAGYDQDAGSRDRITNKTEVILEKPSLTIGIFTQPKRFASIAADNIEMDEGGAWGRFFFSVPTGTRYRSRSVTRVPREVTGEHDARIRAMFDALYDSEEELTVTLTPEAEELFLAHWLARDPALVPQEQRVRIDGWDEKEEGRALRLATLIELYENPASRVIGVERIKDVIAISETMRTHARAASEHIATMEGDPLAPAREVLEWLKETVPKGVVRAASTFKALRGKKSKTIARMDHLMDALRVLEDHRWIEPALLDDHGNGDLRTYLPHPDLREPASRPAAEVPATPDASGAGSAESTDAGARRNKPDAAETERLPKAERLADAVRDCVEGHCVTPAHDAGAAQERLAADELYEVFCTTTDWVPTDHLSSDERAAVPAHQRIDKTRFGAALKAAYPHITPHRTGNTRVGKKLWYVGLKFKNT